MPELVHKEPNDETIAMLEGLLEQARHGDLMGLAAVTLHRRQRSGRLATSTAYQNPTIIAGELYALANRFTRLADGLPA